MPGPQGGEFSSISARLPGALFYYPYPIVCNETTHYPLLTHVSLATLTMPLCLLCLHTHLICIYCTRYHLLYAALYHHSFIYPYVHILYPLTLCIRQ